MEQNDCVFCNIIERSIPAKIIYEDDDVLVVPDILPKAPVHMLVITKRHIPIVSSMTEADEPLFGKMIFIANKVAKDAEVDETGYRLSFNVGREGGQVVPHVHLHVLGGKQLSE